MSVQHVHVVLLLLSTPRPRHVYVGINQIEYYTYDISYNVLPFSSILSPDDIIIIIIV